ncbi:MAG: hypothetical protein LUI09_00940 [Prevotellaceae bacterium]|nr:hypothetical protein [Prevotellaceae bacterium]
MNERSSKMKVVAMIAILSILVGYVTYKRFHHPHAKTGTTIVETDSSIIEVTVEESRDSTGILQYHTTRTVKPKE